MCSWDHPVLSQDGALAWLCLLVEQDSEEGNDHVRKIPRKNFTGANRLNWPVIFTYPCKRHMPRPWISYLRWPNIIIINIIIRSLRNQLMSYSTFGYSRIIWERDMRIYYIKDTFFFRLLQVSCRIAHLKNTSGLANRVKPCSGHK